VFRRTVSKADIHAYGIRVEICPLDEEYTVQIVTGINARMTNAGVQNFYDGNKRVLDRRFLYLDQTMTQSKVTLYHCCGTRVEQGTIDHHSFGMQRRNIEEETCFRVNIGVTGAFEKLAVLYTSRDFQKQEETQVMTLIPEHLKSLMAEGYERLNRKSAESYRNYWEMHDIQVKTDSDKIQLALRFAQYHLQAMIPVDNRSSIAAKGLTGEGYKGHVFWDTEVFILPYFLFCEPHKAKQLLEYRINRIDQAKKNAEKNGYRGIMVPWESAEKGNEETPLFANMDILNNFSESQ